MFFSDTGRWRQTVAVGGLVMVLGTMAAVAHHHQPLWQWLVWKYLGLWLLCLVFSLSCVAAGAPLVHRCLGARLPLARDLLFAFAAGLWVFATGVCLVGFVGGLGPWFFCAWPALLLAAGTPHLKRHLQPRWVRTRRLTPRLGTPSHRWLPWLWAAGALGLALVYIPILTPANVAYDSRWYHMGVAEHYATSGRIAPFVEGWFHGTLPQFASWLYTWALLMPGASLFLRTELAAHLEFTVFLATLVGVSLLVRQISGGQIRRGGWVAMFLFPGLFLYDSNLSLAADHILAFWAPVLVLLLPYTQGPRTKGAAMLLGLFAGAATLAKYQVIYLLAGGALLYLLALLPHLAKHLSWQLCKPHLQVVGLAAGVALLVTSTHWLRNWLWYSNPIYPLAQSVFHGHPWIEGTIVKFNDPGWMPEGNLAERIWQTIAGMFTFSLVPHDWKRFHGRIPVFGALFPLLLLPALGLRHLQQVWKLAAATGLGVLVWYATYHQDRYLQSLLPWMAAIVAVIVARLWQTRVRVVQAALAGVLVFSVVWGSDVPFLPTHPMAGKSPFEHSLHLASSSYRKAWDEQAKMHSKLPELAPHLPDAITSTLLLHEEHLRFGIGRPVVVDGHGRQGRMGYHELQTPGAVYQQLQSLGITHILWAENPSGLMRLTDDLVFHSFVRDHTDKLEIPERRLSALRSQAPPPQAAPTHVVFVTCAGVTQVPWGEVNRKWKRHFKPGCDGLQVSLSDVQAATQTAQYLVLDQDLPAPETWAEGGWKQLFTFKGVIAYSRPI